MKTNTYYLLTFNYDTSSPDIVDVFTDVNKAIDAAKADLDADMWVEDARGNVIYS